MIYPLFSFKLPLTKSLSAYLPNSFHVFLPTCWFCTNVQAQNVYLGKFSIKTYLQCVVVVGKFHENKSVATIYKITQNIRLKLNFTSRVVLRQYYKNKLSFLLNEVLNKYMMNLESRERRAASSSIWSSQLPFLSSMYYSNSSILTTTSDDTYLELAQYYATFPHLDNMCQLLNILHFQVKVFFPVVVVSSNSTYYLSISVCYEKKIQWVYVHITIFLYYLFPHILNQNSLIS